MPQKFVLHEKFIEMPGIYLTMTCKFKTCNLFCMLYLHNDKPNRILINCSNWLHKNRKRFIKQDESLVASLIRRKRAEE